MSYSRQQYIKVLEFEQESSRQIQTAITFDSVYDWGPWYIEVLEIEKWKLSRNSNSHNLH